MTLTLNKNDFLTRFVSCARGAALLKILVAAARRAKAGETFLFFPAGFNFSDGFRPIPMNKKSLTRRGIFRGKISQRKNQNQKTHLEERTL
jgi:hypothetical protein